MSREEIDLCYYKIKKKIATKEDIERFQTSMMISCATPEQFLEICEERFNKTV